MAQVHKNDEITKVVLPSYGTGENEAYVNIKKNVTVGDVISIDDSLSEKEKAVLIITKSIKDWNLTDNDVALPITEENVRALSIGDFYALMQAINIEGINAEKKSN